MKVEFDSYRNPSTLRKISYWISGIGVFLILIDFALLYSVSFQSIELQLFYFFEMPNPPFMSFIIAGISFIIIGQTFKRLSWLNGTLNIDSESISINYSDNTLTFEYNKILRLKLLKSNQIEIRTRDNSVKVNFFEYNDLNEVWNAIDEQTEDVIISKLNTT